MNTRMNAGATPDGAMRPASGRVVAAPCRTPRPAHAGARDGAPWRVRIAAPPALVDGAAPVLCPVFGAGERGGTIQRDRRDAGRERR